MKKIRGKKMIWTAERIKALRDEFGESREQFAERLSASKFTLRNWEQGQFEPSGRVQMLLDRLQDDLREGRVKIKQPA